MEREGIEITPAMIEAGVEAFWANDVEEIGSTVLVQLIYRSMRLTELCNNLSDRSNEPVEQVYD